MRTFLFYLEVLFSLFCFSGPFQKCYHCFWPSLTQQTFIPISCYITNIGNSHGQCPAQCLTWQKDTWVASDGCPRGEGMGINRLRVTRGLGKGWRQITGPHLATVGCHPCLKMSPRHPTATTTSLILR